MYSIDNFHEQYSFIVRLDFQLKQEFNYWMTQFNAAYENVQAEFHKI